MSIALHAGPSEDEELNGHRRPHPDLVHLCYELQGGPAMPMTMPVTRRIADVWRAPGTFEDRLLAVIKAANDAGPYMWEQIIHAQQEQHRFDYEQFKIYMQQLQANADAATSDAVREMWRKRIAEENRAFFGTRFIESCGPAQPTNP